MCIYIYRERERERDRETERQRETETERQRERMEGSQIYILKTHGLECKNLVYTCTHDLTGRNHL
jgi:hypothetical protein